MIKKKKNIVVALSFAFGLFLISIFSVNDASAININISSILKKWAFTQYFQCVAAQKINTPLATKDSGYMYKDVMQASGTIPMPSRNFGNRLNDQPINCQELFRGSDDGKWKGVFDFNGNGSYKTLEWGSNGSWGGSGVEASNNFMLNVGYTLNENGDGLMSLLVHTATGVLGNDGKIDSGTQFTDGTLTSVQITIKWQESSSSYHYSWDSAACSRAYKIQFCSGTKDGNQTLTIRPSTYLNDTAEGGEYTITLDKYDIEKTKANIRDTLDGKSYVFVNWGNGSYQSYYFDADDIIDYSNDGVYTFANTRANLVESMKNLSGGMDPSSSKLDNTERYNLYMYYLDKIAPVSARNRWTCDSGESSTSHTEIKNIKDKDGEFKTCYVKFGDVDFSEKNLWTQRTAHEGNVNSEYTYIDSINMSEIINWFSHVDTDSLGSVWDWGSVGSIIDLDESEGYDDDQCNKAGLGAQGWVLCPILDNSTKSVDFFEDLIREWMTFDTGYLDTKNNTGSGVFTAWEIFRNIANVIMIIVLLAVIFSQLTGWGIDNYGIKKILPRLIAIGILINLSYTICELLIDLSNLLGVGLDKLFHAIGDAINDNSGLGEAAATAAAGTGAAIGTAGIVVGAVLAGAASGGLVGMIIALILVLVTALIAVLMFFVTLGARLVIILMFTVIAPIAFACYILPNTQKFFKKWWEVFKTALVIFPICGAVYGLSFIIKAIVFNVAGNDLSGMNFWMAVVAVLTPYMPFLMIPTMLKGALKGLGVLGATIGMLGAGLSKGADSLAKGIKSTDRYNNAAKQSRANMKIRGMNRFNERHKDEIESGNWRSKGAFNEYRRRNLEGALALDQREREYTTAFSHQGKTANANIFGQAINNQDAAMAGAAWTALLSQGGLVEADSVLSKTKINSLDPAFKDKLMQKISQTAGAGEWQLYAKDVLGGCKLEFDKYVGEASEKYGQNGRDIQFVKNNQKQYQEIMDYAAGQYREDKALIDKASKGFSVDHGELDLAGRRVGKYEKDKKLVNEYNGALNRMNEYEDWRESTGGKYGSLAAALEPRGENAFVGSTDDEMKLIDKHASSLATGLGVEKFSKMLANAQCYNKDGKAQLVASSTLGNMIASGGISSEQLSQVFRANDFGHMTDTIANSLKSSIEKGLNSGKLKIDGISAPPGGIDTNELTKAISTVFKAQVTQLSRDSNSKSNLSPAVAKMLGMM